MQEASSPILKQTLSAITHVGKPTAVGEWFETLSSNVCSNSEDDIEAILSTPEYIDEWASSFVDVDSGVQSTEEIWSSAMALLLVAPLIPSEEVTVRAIEHLHAVHDHLSRRDWESLLLHAGTTHTLHTTLSKRTAYLLRAMNPDSRDYGLHRLVLEDLLASVSNGAKSVNLELAKEAA